MREAEPSLDDLRAAIQLACQPQNTGLIVAGRERVLAMPREWVLQHLERIALESLDLSDYWEYRRLLEMAQLLDVALLPRFVSFGLDSSDPDVCEAAEDFQRHLPGRCS